MYDYDITLTSKDGEQVWQYVIYNKIEVSKKCYENQKECMNEAEKKCNELNILTEEMEKTAQKIYKDFFVTEEHVKK